MTDRITVPPRRARVARDPMSGLRIERLLAFRTNQAVGPKRPFIEQCVTRATRAANMPLTRRRLAEHAFERVFQEFWRPSDHGLRALTMREGLLQDRQRTRGQILELVEKQCVSADSAAAVGRVERSPNVNP